MASARRIPPLPPCCGSFPWLVPPWLHCPASLPCAGGSGVDDPPRKKTILITHRPCTLRGSKSWSHGKYGTAQRSGR